MVLPRLTPAIAAERLYPRNAVFMARTDLEQTRLMVFEPWNLESITNIFLGLMNGLATVRHRSGVTDEVLALFDRAGLPVDEKLHAYETGEEAESITDELVRNGGKIVFLYPLRESRFADGAYLVPPSLWRQLNSKRNLGQLTSAEHLAPREVCSLLDLETRGFQRAIFLKDASLEASGGGCAIRACLDADQWRRSFDELRAIGVTEFLVEEALPVERCWCIVLVLDDQQTTYGGASEQVFETPGQQSGNIIDPQHPLPADGVTIALQVGEAARKAGFRGVAGVDIGLTSDQRLIVFDPNFRINSSSSQTLLHASAARRVDLPVSYSVHVSTHEPLVQAIENLRGPVDDGWFVPARFLDARLLPSANGQSVCSGFVMAKDRPAALAAERRLKALF